MLLDLAVDGPDEGAEAELGTVGVEGAEAVEDGVDAAVVDHGEDGAGDRGPGVGAVVGLAVDAAATGDALPGGEAPAVAALEDVDDFIVVCLVVGYKDGFHCGWVKGYLAASWRWSLRRWFLMPRRAKTQ